MFQSKLSWIFDFSGMTHLILPYESIDDVFWSQVKLNVSQNKLNIENALRFHYPGTKFEDIKFFKKAIECKPNTTRSRLNHILFIPPSNLSTDIHIQHLPKIKFSTSGILIIDSLFSVKSQSKGIISAVLKDVSKAFEFRILSSYTQFVNFFDNKGWCPDY